MQAPPELNAEVDGLLTHYPPGQKRSAMLMVLHAIQERLGCISDEMVEWAAVKLGVQPINVFECVTFYPMFRRAPAGKYHIKICRTLSCELAGGQKLCDELKRRIGFEKMDEVTKDGMFTVSWIECLASCDTGPCLMINDDLHERVTPEKLDQILKPLLEAAVAKPAATQAPFKQPTPMIRVYNRGIALFREGQFERALEVFTSCLTTDELKWLAAFGCERCQVALGRPVSLPEEFSSRPDDLNALAVACNVVCHLLEQGHKAMLEPYGTATTTYNVVARIQKANYTIQVRSLSGEFVNWAWREMKDRTISVADPKENPEPTPVDQLVISLIESASSLPLSPLPEDGLPIEVEDEEEETQGR